MLGRIVVNRLKFSRPKMPHSQASVRHIQLRTTPLSSEEQQTLKETVYKIVALNFGIAVFVVYNVESNEKLFQLAEKESPMLASAALKFRAAKEYVLDLWSPSRKQ